MNVTVVGAGLAGSEAAYQLLKHGFAVRMLEMRPAKLTPAHTSGRFAELVCSNSLRSDRLENAAGLLKEEMRRLDSLIMRAAEASRVPAGGALAVDREQFSQYIQDTLFSFPAFSFSCCEVTEIPPKPVIVAAGPLCSDKLAEAIRSATGEEHCHFFDAAAPIITKESIDFSKAFVSGRYGRGDDYINCPMDQEQYERFVTELVHAETAPVHGFEGQVFEGCMPVEVMASRGMQTLAFGPLKPVGLTDPNTGKRPYAVVQLRQDDARDTLYNIVGFQTHLRFPEQKRVFSMIPGLENCEIVRYGVMHRNTFLCAPKLLDHTFALKNDPLVAFAGQITGVEGYIESAASGFLCAVSMASRLQGKEPLDFTSQTALGALGHYVSIGSGEHFQPMNINFGIMDPLDRRVRSKQERCACLAERALQIIDSIKERV